MFLTPSAAHSIAKDLPRFSTPALAAPKYRVTSSTCSCFSEIPWKKWLVQSARAQWRTLISFYKLPETHGHVKLDILYHSMLREDVQIIFLAAPVAEGVGWLTTNLVHGHGWQKNYNWQWTTFFPPYVAKMCVDPFSCSQFFLFFTSHIRNNITLLTLNKNRNRLIMNACDDD